MALQTVDDALALLRTREDAPVRLYREGNSMTLKPAAGFLRTEDVKPAAHESMAPRIDLCEVCHSSESVGQIATASARHFHLAEHTLCSFKDDDSHLRHHLLQVDSQKKSCCTASDDSRLQCLFALESKSDVTLLDGIFFLVVTNGKLVAIDGEGLTADAVGRRFLHVTLHLLDLAVDFITGKSRHTRLGKTTAVQREVEAGGHLVVFLEFHAHLDIHAVEEDRHELLFLIPHLLIVRVAGHLSDDILTQVIGLCAHIDTSVPILSLSTENTEEAENTEKVAFHK